MLGYAYASRVSPMYEAEAKLAIALPVGTVEERLAAGEAIPTYAELVTTRELLEPTFRRLGLPFLPQEWGGDVRGEAGEQNRILTVRVRSEQAARAIQIANALARELVRFVERKAATSRTTAPETTPDVQLRIVERATRADRVQPQTVLTTEFAALAAGFAALAVCVLLELTSRKVRDEDDLARLAPSVLGSVNGRALSVLGDGSPWPGADESYEPYRLLARRVDEAGAHGAPRSLLVLGAEDRSGSGAVALNLAAALVAPATRVVVADISPEREILRLVERTSSPTSLGRPVRHGRLTFDRFSVQRSSQVALAVPRSPDVRVTNREEAETLLALLLADAEVVIVHAPSLRGTPAALAWASAVSGALVVARRRHTRRDSISDVLDSLGRAQANVVGAVLHEGR